MVARARKPWGELSPGYRRKLTRAGITPQAHAQGASLRAVRKYKPEEAVRKRSYRSVRQWAVHMEQTYYLDADSILGFLEDEDVVKVAAEIRKQQDAENAYLEGELDGAHDAWEERDIDYPDWMYYYHPY